MNEEELRDFIENCSKCKTNTLAMYCLIRSIELSLEKHGLYNKKY